MGMKKKRGNKIFFLGCHMKTHELNVEHCMTANNYILSLKGTNKSIIELGMEFIFEKNEQSI